MFCSVGVNGTYPRVLGNFKIKNIRDLTIGYDDAQPNCHPILPVSASTQVSRECLLSGFFGHSI
jgi:hypothetical protein